MSEGVWGYSGPNEEHVVFSVDTGMEEYTRRCFNSCGLLEGVGKWQNNEAEPCFIVMAKVWDFAVAYGFAAVAMQQQQQVLYLGHLKSRNWRDAVLVDAPFPLMRDMVYSDEDALTWLEATQDEAEASEGYTRLVLGGVTRWFICQNNPPIDEEDRKERLYTDAVINLMAVLVQENLDERSISGAETPIQKKRNEALDAMFPLVLGKTMPNGETVHDFTPMNRTTQPVGDMA